MAEFDFSSYPKPQQQPNNPLDMVTKVGQVNDVLGNMEVGKAMQGALDPSTGEIDRTKLGGFLARTNAGAQKILPTLQAHEQLRSAGFQADQQGLDTFQKRMAITNSMMGSLASNPTKENLYSIAGRIMDPAINGPKYGMTLPVVMNALKQFRGPDGKWLPPAEIAKKAREIQTMTMSSQEQLAAHAPQYDVKDDGNSIQFIPRGTTVAPQAPPSSIPKTLSPETEVFTPEGPRRYGTQRPAPIGPPQALPGQNNPLSGVITGVERGPVTNPVTGASSSFNDRFDSAYNKPPAGPATGQRPGLGEAQKSVAEESARIGNSITSAAAELPATRGILQNLERELDNFESGPGAAQKKLVIGAINANIPVPKSWQEPGSFLDPKKVADQEGFNKFAYELAQRQFAALGGTGTDAKLNSTMSTSPNEAISKIGNKNIIRILKGNADALEIKAREWNKWKKTNGPDTAAEFNEDFTQHFDPRVFQFKHVPRDERAAWFRAMSDDEKAAFQKSAQYAREKKWLRKEDL